MRVLRRIRNHPVAVLCVAAAGLGAWVAADLLGLRDTPRNPPPLRALPKPPVALLAEREAPAPPAVAARGLPVPVEVLPRLKPGMTRVEVEGLLGSPDRVCPVSADDGRLTYRTAYELADPELPMTIRPILIRPRLAPRPGDPKSLVALEYDASRPGHPLVEVFYPDPLF